MRNVKKFDISIQEILRNALKAYNEKRLQAQNITPDPEKFVSCKYAGPHGPCAIGASIPKDVAKNWDRYAFSASVLVYDQILTVSDERPLNAGLDEIAKDLANLQSLHDNWANVGSEASHKTKEVDFLFGLHEAINKYIPRQPGFSLSARTQKAMFFETTIQEILRNALKAYNEKRLQAQGPQIDVTVGCKYAGPVSSCAIGVSIPNEIGRNWDDLSLSVASLVLNYRLVVSDERDYPSFDHYQISEDLNKLQCTHDAWAASESPKMRERNELKFTEALYAACEEYGVPVN